MKKKTITIKLTDFGYLTDLINLPTEISWAKIRSMGKFFTLSCALSSTKNYEIFAYANRMYKLRRTK